MTIPKLGPGKRSEPARRSHTEAEADLDEEVTDDVETTQVFQVYAWTFSGIPVVDSQIVVKVGYTGTGPTSDAWRRMADIASERVTRRAPTMLASGKGPATRTAHAQPSRHFTTPRHRASSAAATNGSEPTSPNWIQRPSRSASIDSSRSIPCRSRLMVGHKAV